MEKMKYVKIGDYNSIIIFPCIIEHSDFRHMKPISAGFCFIGLEEINCFGRSISLNLESDENDSFEATKQYCGIESAIALKLNLLENNVKKTEK